MLNDKIFGIMALVLMALGLMVLSFFTKSPIDPVIDKTVNSIISGILGAMIGFPAGMAIGKLSNKNGNQQETPPPGPTQ